MSVPETLDELLSPAWLTAALQPRFPGICVTAVTPGPIVSRVSTNARFHIDCAGGVPEGLSPDLCAKGYFSEAGRPYRQAGLPEATFYRDLASSTGVRTLRSVYADVDQETQHGVVITEDVVVQGATFLDALSDYTPDQVADSLQQLATLHASTWCRPMPEWLAPRLTSYLEVRGIPEIRYNFDGPIGAGVPDDVRDAERLYEAYARLAAVAGSEKQAAVVHGDAHVGNFYLDACRRPSLLDWQCVQQGPWYVDVGYHIASALIIEDRRRTERDLLRHYLDQLAAAGVDAPGWEDAWLGFRRGIVHGFYLWGITQKVAPPITTTLLTRLGTAAADHDSFGALEAR